MQCLIYPSHSPGRDQRAKKKKRKSIIYSFFLFSPKFEFSFLGFFSIFGTQKNIMINCANIRTNSRIQANTKQYFCACFCLHIRCIVVAFVDRLYWIFVFVEFWMHFIQCILFFYYTTKRESEVKATFIYFHYWIDKDELNMAKKKLGTWNHLYYMNRIKMRRRMILLRIRKKDNHGFNINNNKNNNI